MNNRNKMIIAALLCGSIAMTGCEGMDSIYVENSSSTAAAQTDGGTSSHSSTADDESSTVAVSSAQSTSAPAEEQPTVPPVPISFSAESGIYESEFSLTLSSSSGLIYYTTDGSDPATSETAILYSEPIPITDRKNDKNVVSAVDPVLFAGTYSKVNKDRNGFDNEISPPSDKAVDKCTVIRAAVKREDGIFAGESSAAYFIGTAEEHIEGLAESCKAAGQPLAVMSLSVNYDDFFGYENGIYVKGAVYDNALEDYLAEHKRVRDPETARSLDANYKQKGRAWEREAAMTLFEFSEDGTAQAVLTQNCGVRVQGNYSRSDLQKGLRLYARTDYGENNFDYAVFGEDYLNKNGEVMDKFDTLVLRNGGNCAFIAKFNDTYWQSLVTDMNVATQKSRPCVVYLNGEYWGLYVLQEDYTNDFCEDVYGVNKDDVVIYKGDAEALELGYKLDEGDLPEGVDDEQYYFNELFDFFRTHSSLKDEADYNEFIKLVDPDSVMDYFAVQSWIDNKWDWPGKNWSMWKTTTNDGSEYGDSRWRLMLYDIEFGGICGGGDAGNNTIKNANYKSKGLLDMDTDNPAVLCFAYLMTNEGFFNRFCDRLEGLSEGNFEQGVAVERLNEFADIYSPLYPQFFQRYEGATDEDDDPINGGYGSVKCITEFLDARSGNIGKMVRFCAKTLNFER